MDATAEPPALRLLAVGRRSLALPLPGTALFAPLLPPLTAGGPPTLCALVGAGTEHRDNDDDDDGRLAVGAPTVIGTAAVRVAAPAVAGCFPARGFFRVDWTGCSGRLLRAVEAGEAGGTALLASAVEP